MDERHLKSWIVKILPSEDAEVAEGTGFWAADGRYVLTCTHVVEGMNPPWIEYNDQKAPAEIIAQEGDVTLLKVQGLSGEPAPLGTAWQRGDTIDSLGYQYEGVDPRIGYFPIEGAIAGSSELDGTERITLEEAIHVKPGASGAPALNRHAGKVIGIISDKWEQQQVAFVLPLSKVLKQWDVLKKAIEKIEVEPLRNAICQFLKEIESDPELNSTTFFHIQQPIVLKDQYIPIEVTLERRYYYEEKKTLDYVESEEALTRAYAMKGFYEELQQKKEDTQTQEEKRRRTQVPWKEAKQKYRRIIVLADPGMGKTALLKMEAVITAQEQRQNLVPQVSSLEANNASQMSSFAIKDVIFPLFLRLSELAEKEEEIIDAIPKLIQRKYPHTVPVILPLLQEKLENGKCLLLLDDLDGVPKKQRNQFSKKLNRFAYNYPCPIICTSRIVGYGGGFLHDAKEVEIIPFSQKQIEQYIETWFDNAEESLQDSRSFRKPRESETAEENIPSVHGLIHELRQKPQIQGLAQNPLPLSLLCSLYYRQKLSLPARKVQIYKQALEYMLSIWSRNRKPQSIGRIRAKTRLLEELAYQFSCEYKEMFSANDLYDKIENYLQSDHVSSVFKHPHSNSAELITELSEEDGIIKKLEWEDNHYLFLHRTFQEYLTASYLNRQKDRLELAKCYFWDYDWHEIITLFVGLLDDPIPLLKAIISEKDDIFSTLLLLAGRCLPECEKQTHPLIKHIVDKIFTFWRSYSGLAFIGSTVTSIVQSNEQLLEDFKKNLYDEKGLLTIGAINVLGRIVNPQATSVLIQTFSHEYDAHNKTSTFIQRHIAHTLQKIDLPEAIKALDQKVEALIPYIHHKDMKTREDTIWFLGDIGTSKAIEILHSVLSDESERIQTIALTVLGQIGNKKAIQVLTEAIDQKSEHVNRMAISRLGQIGNEEAIQSLAQVIHHPNSDIRMLAVSALSESTNIKAVEVLAKALNHHDMHVRITAVNALGRIDSQEAINVLIQAFDHQDKMVKIRAVLTLRLLSSQDAKNALSQAYKHHDDLVRLMAKINPKKIENQELAQLLESLNELSKQTLSRQDMKIQQIVSAVLEKYSETEAAEIFAQYFKDENSGTRWNAVKALQQLAHSKSIEVLKNAFNDPDKLIRVEAVIALKEIALQKKESVSQQAIKALQQALIHQDNNVRVMAVDALGKVGTSETLGILIKHPEIDIYDSINFLLARTIAVRFSKEDTPFIPVYSELLKNKPPELRVCPDLRKSKHDA